MDPIFFNAIRQAEGQLPRLLEQSEQKTSLPLLVVAYYQAQMHEAIMTLWEKFRESLEEQAEQKNEDYRAHEKRSQEKVAAEKAFYYWLVRQAGHFRFLEMSGSTDYRI